MYGKKISSFAAIIAYLKLDNFIRPSLIEKYLDQWSKCFKYWGFDGRYFCQKDIHMPWWFEAKVVMLYVQICVHISWGGIQGCFI